MPTTRTGSQSATHEEDIAIEQDLRDNSPAPARAQSVETENTAMLQLLTELTNRVTAGGKKLTRVNDPDSFSGRKRSQFRIFMKQCESVFHARSSEFDTDSTKISYTGTYLTDEALEWYHDLLPEIDQFETWDQFKELMHKSFGDPNEIATAERQLHQLRMGSDQDCITYVTKFRSLISVLKWKEDSPIMANFR